ncbi:unnamed protein product [Ixodes pacificus]
MYAGGKCFSRGRPFHSAHRCWTPRPQPRHSGVRRKGGPHHSFGGGVLWGVLWESPWEPFGGTAWSQRGQGATRPRTPGYGSLAGGAHYCKALRWGKFPERSLWTFGSARYYCRGLNSVAHFVPLDTAGRDL